MTASSTGKSTTFASWALGLSVALLSVAAAPRVAHWFNGSHGRATVTSQHRRKGRVRTGTERIAFFIASSTCGASEHRKLPEALAIIRRNLAERAQADNKEFVYVGVALDEQPEAGWNFLKRFGPFDEVLTGGSWFGTGSVDLLVRGAPGPLAMPQLLIVEREVVANQSSLVVGPDKVVSRTIGFAEIFKMAGLSESGEAKVAFGSASVPPSGT